MGYLDSDTIVVDAILTKNGRKKLSEPGGSLSITQFALSDDGIDYSLWNSDHPSGSAHYADAITKLPQTEAVPHDGVQMRYLLLTMNRNTTFMPNLKGVQSSYTLESQSDKAVINGVTDNGMDARYKISVPDLNQWIISGGTVTRLGGAVGGNRLAQGGIPQPGYVIGTNITIKAAPTNTTRRGIFTIYGMDTGVTKTFQVTASPNILQKPKA